MHRAILTHLEDGQERWEAANLPDRLFPSLLANLDLDGGSAWTYVPGDLDENTVYSFNSSGVSPDESGDRRGWVPVSNPSKTIVVETVKNYLYKHPDAYLIAEDTLTTPHEVESTQPETEPFLFVDEDLNAAYFASAKTATEKKIGEIIDMGLHVSISFITNNNQLTLWSRRRVNDDEARKIVLGTVSIIVTAYDGEGYLFWHKDKDLDC